MSGDGEDAALPSPEASTVLELALSACAAVVDRSSEGAVEVSLRKQGVRQRFTLVRESLLSGTLLSATAATAAWLTTAA